MSLQPPPEPTEQSIKQPMEQEEEPTEDEYFEQELLDFLEIIETISKNLNNLTAYQPSEPKDIIECIITRFNKINFPMPSDQWNRVYMGLKQLSQIITSNSPSFEIWTLLPNLFKSAKQFRTKYPTAQSGQSIRQQQLQQKQKQKSMNQMLNLAKEFANDKGIKINSNNSNNNNNNSRNATQILPIKTTKMTKPITKQSKIKQIINKNPIKSSESSILNPKPTIKSVIKSSISKQSLITKKNVAVKEGHHHERDRRKDRDRHRHRHRHRSLSVSRSRSRSRDRDRHRHRSSRHGHRDRDRDRDRDRERDNYRSRSTSKTRDRHRPRTSSDKPLDKWGLHPPIHSIEYTNNMCTYQSKQRDIMYSIDNSIDDMEKIPVVYGDSEICHGFNEGRCRLDPCKYQHVCWSCKGRGHPSSLCPYKPTRPYNAPPSHHKPCINWNINGCPGGCLCADRHICLFCRGHHPMRHSFVCQWKFNREIQMNKRKPLDANKKVKDLQNLNPIGQYEHLRLKDEENGTFHHENIPMKIMDTNQNNNSNNINNKNKNKNSNNNKLMRDSITPPPSMTIPTSFMAKNIEKDETVSITEICVLYNTPSGCPAKYGKNDNHLYLINDNGSGIGNNLNPNIFNGICQLKHRCRECFGRHSYFNCPFRYHGIKCFIVNDIVRYNEFHQRVYVVNGFIDRRDTSIYNNSYYNRHSKYNKQHHKNKPNLKSKELQSPKIKITEVGLDITAAQIEINANTLNKIVSSVKMQYKYPKMIIKELPTTISSQQVENKLKLLFHEKQIKNIVRIQSTTSQSNWIISFLTVTDRQNAFILLSDVTMQARELKISIYDDNDSNDSNDSKNDKILSLITKDEVPVHEHLYYCIHCDIGLFEYGLLRQHLISSTHIAAIQRSHINKQNNNKQINVNNNNNNNNNNENININECILCNQTIINKTMSEHIKSTLHDNSNILMMLSLLRCNVNKINKLNIYECQVCKIIISNSREYFIHCNTDKHRSGLEEVIEPCPYFNKRGSGCQNERCQFKHVCVGCNAVTPIYRCKKCKNNEVCNMFNKGGAGCWYARGSCHRRHICHYCHGSHPKVGCPKLYPNNKKEFNSQGQEIKKHHSREPTTTTTIKRAHRPPPNYPYVHQPHQPPPPPNYPYPHGYPPPPGPMPPNSKYSNYPYPPPPQSYPHNQPPTYHQSHNNYPYPPPPPTR